MNLLFSILRAVKSTIKCWVGYRKSRAYWRKVDISKRPKRWEKALRRWDAPLWKARMMERGEERMLALVEGLKTPEVEL